MSSVSPSEPVRHVHGDVVGADDPTEIEPLAPSAAGGRPRGRLVLAGLAVAGVLSASGGAWLWSVRGQTVFVDMLASALAMCF